MSIIFLDNFIKILINKFKKFIKRIKQQTYLVYQIYYYILPKHTSQKYIEKLLRFINLKLGLYRLKEYCKKLIELSITDKLY